MALRGRKDWEIPPVINIDKTPVYGVAIAELKTEGLCPDDVAHRPIKYLSNIVEAGHGKLKRLIKSAL